jgi:membrane-associated phospholipid phosphatase
VALVVTIGVARVYTGKHDTTDVLAGWILGGLWAGAVTRSSNVRASDCAQPAHSLWPTSAVKGTASSKST